MSHLEYMLRCVANVQFKNLITNQMTSSFPLLGTCHLECDMIDYGLNARDEANPPRLYARLRGNGELFEPVSMFACSDALGLPAHAPKLRDRGYFELWKKTVKQVGEMEDELRAAGCSSICGYRHCAPAKEEGASHIEQFCLYVPKVRIFEDGEGRLLSEPNEADQVKFISYLTRKGLVSPELNESEIIGATNARVLHLVRGVTQAAKLTP